MDKWTVNLQHETDKLRASNTRFDEKLKTIIERDTAHQNEVAARGGTARSTLTPPAAEAAEKVIAQRNRARADLTKPVRDAATAEQRRRIEKTLASAKAFLADFTDLQAFEYALNAYFVRAEQAGIPTVAHGDAVATVFAQRVERLLRPAVAPPSPRPRLTLPDFTDLTLS